MEELDIEQPDRANQHNNCSCCIALDRRRVSLSLRSAIFLGVSCIAGIVVLTTLFSYMLTLDRNVKNPPLVETKADVNSTEATEDPFLPNLVPLKRLPDYVLPDSYDLKFMPILDEGADNFTFYGEVSARNLMASITSFEKLCNFTF